MGTSYYVYIGPYIEVFNPEKETFVDHYGCLNNQCCKHKVQTSSKFCPECGHEVGTFQVSSKTRPYFDAYGETDGHLCDSFSYMPAGKEDCHVYVPNVGNYGKHFSSWESQLIPLNETVIADETNRFKTELAEDIAKVKEFFGEANVKILWGVMAYAS